MCLLTSSKVYTECGWVVLLLLKPFNAGWWRILFASYFAHCLLPIPLRAVWISQWTGVDGSRTDVETVALRDVIRRRAGRRLQEVVSLHQPPKLARSLVGTGNRFPTHVPLYECEHACSKTS